MLPAGTQCSKGRHTLRCNRTGSHKPEPRFCLPIYKMGPDQSRDGTMMPSMPPKPRAGMNNQSKTIDHRQTKERMKERRAKKDGEKEQEAEREERTRKEDAGAKRFQVCPECYWAIS